MFNEYRHCGVDYSKAAQADRYDDQHRKFRDYGREFNAMLDFLQIGKPGDGTVIELGCGTGTTALLAAELFKAVYAVDVSEAMLARARAKNDRNLGNIVFVTAGFLTYAHGGEPVDLVITKAALHHLPDFWKQIALLRINRMLKRDGLLYLHDVVFQFDPHQYHSRIDAWIAGLRSVGGDELAADAETHIRDEYSIFDWILRGMLSNAGFVVEKARSDDGFVAEYACRKVREVEDEEPA
jgi:SAM-dependent methyltransferase